MVLSTLFGEGRARLAGNNYGNFVVFQVSFKFLLFLSYFVKPSREPIKQSITKVQARYFRIYSATLPLRSKMYKPKTLKNGSLTAVGKLRLFTIYMGKPFGSRFGQLVSKIPYCGSPFGTGVYHLHKSLPITERVWNWYQR